MKIHEALWTCYTKTIVEVMPPGTATFRICRAPLGEVGEWPPMFTAPIFVITAWNPASHRIPPDANRERQEALETDLRQLAEVQLWPSVGLDPDSEYREEGVAVSGLSEEEAIRLGARYDQNAIFAWTPETWAVVSCLDKRCHEAGWFLETLWEPDCSAKEANK